MAYFSGDIYSKTLRYNTRITAVFPDGTTEPACRFPGEPKVLFLLHGLSDNASTWTRFTKVEYYAKQYNFVVIMPDGARSFYTDMQEGMPYFTYVADELPEMAGKILNISTKREDTFIAGLSMGGYGAAKIGLSRPETFAGLGTFSGALDLAESIAIAGTKNDTLMHPDEFKAMFGPAMKLPAEDDIFALAEKEAKDPNRPKFFQCIGTEDFLYAQNQRFRAKMKEVGYDELYMDWPGVHCWLFWDVAIQRAMQFFRGLDPRKEEIC